MDDSAFCFRMVIANSLKLKTSKLTFFDPIVWDAFVKPGEIVEVRILNARGKSEAWGYEFSNGTVSGYFDDHEQFCMAVKVADKKDHSGIYVTLQVIDPRLIGRAFNRLKPSKLTTADNNVIAYRWLPIDCDPGRPAGTSSSDTELNAAIETRDKIACHMMSAYHFPAPIKAMSGNGGHLLFKLPDVTIEHGKSFIESTLTQLANQFNTDTVCIDTKVFNPSRIWKLYGTTARKGDPVPAGPKREARPHRLAYIDDLGANGNG